MAIPLHSFIKGCGSKTYGGFNDSTCQPCPLNSVSGGGFLATTCECSAGYMGQNGEPCTGMIQYVYFHLYFCTLQLVLLGHLSLQMEVLLVNHVQK